MRTRSTASLDASLAKFHKDNAAIVKEFGG
jgi:hypothetical protein